VFDVAFLTGVEEVTELILVRHGQQAVRDLGAGPVGDAIDPPLSELGLRQAELVGKRFADERVDAVYTSNLRRAHDTGAAVARHHGLEPLVLEDLREVELFRDIPPERSAVEFIGRPLMLGIRERMIVERRWDVYPFSESSFDFRKRTVNAIEAIAATNLGRRVVIACHGGVINAYVAHLLGVDEDMFFRPAHTAVNVVLSGRHGVRALQALGDVHHLAGEVGAVTY
jgi:probable phosphoglycerate mutase